MLEGNFSRTLSSSRTNVVILKHAHVPDIDFHLSGTCNLPSRTFTAIVLGVRAGRRARDVRRRQRSSRADGVCQRDARAWRGEARGRSARRGTAVRCGKFQRKTSEKNRNKEDRSQKRPGGLR